MSCWTVTICGDVELAGFEHLHQTRGHLLRIGEAETRATEVRDGLDDQAAVVAAQLIAALAADAQDLDRLAFSQQRANGPPRFARDRAVEAAAQAAVAGSNDHEMSLVGAGAGQQARAEAALEARPERRQNLVHRLGVGTGRKGLLLGTPQLGRGDHLHGLRDLLRRLHASNTKAEGLQTGHRSLGGA
jgi:hypothetical protein